MQVIEETNCRFKAVLRQPVNIHNKETLSSRLLFDDYTTFKRQDNWALSTVYISTILNRDADLIMTIDIHNEEILCSNIAIWFLNHVRVAILNRAILNRVRLVNNSSIITVTISMSFQFSFQQCVWNVVQVKKVQMSSYRSLIIDHWR